MRFLPGKYMSPLNRAKDFLSCRAQWAVSMVKNQPATFVPLARYGSHKFSSKFPKFVEKPKIRKFCGLPFLHIIRRKINFNYVFLFVIIALMPSYLCCFLFCISLIKRFLGHTSGLQGSKWVTKKWPEYSLSPPSPIQL